MKSDRPLQASMVLVAMAMVTRALWGGGGSGVAITAALLSVLGALGSPVVVLVVLIKRKQSSYVGVTILLAVLSGLYCAWLATFGVLVALFSSTGGGFGF